MTLYVESFERPDALTDFVNDNTIPANQIVTIREYAGRWFLFYYA